MEEVVKVESVTKAYGALLAVDQVSLSVKRGTAFGLLGANGAGKSTTIECILGTKRADDGTVSVLALNPRKDRRSLFQQVGVQFQECGYQPEIRVSELCEETACLYKAPADWKGLCEQFGIGDKTGTPVKSLSGGERQRLFIGLDARARRGVWKILKELKDGGLTIFLTSHFMDEVEALCDEICILQKGRAVFYGTVAQAKEKSGCENFEDAYLKLSGEGIE